MDKVFDFDDFVQCVKNVGDMIVMKCEDFFTFENGLSQSLESKPNKPLLTRRQESFISRSTIFKEHPIRNTL